jgi:hypothetical protein
VVHAPRPQARLRHGKTGAPVAQQWSAGTRTSRSRISQWPSGAWWCTTVMLRTTCTPGVSMGTSTMLCWWCTPGLAIAVFALALRCGT